MCSIRLRPRLRRRCSASSPMLGLRLRRRHYSTSTSPIPRMRHASTLPMPRLRHSSSTTPMSRRRSSSTTSPPSPSWSPHAAFAAATERVRAGTLSPEDAHHLFDEMLGQANPVPECSLNGFLAALARAPESDSCRDGPALALALFNRICREEAGLGVAQPTIFTYGVLMNCCWRAGRQDLGPAFFGRLLKTDLKTNTIVANSLLKCLCCAKRTDEAVSVLLHRMSELGCLPDARSYTTVLKGLCDDKRSQGALDLLQKMAKEGGDCSPDVVTYTTVIYGFFKEGEISHITSYWMGYFVLRPNDAKNMFRGMIKSGTTVKISTYNIVLAGLCRNNCTDEAIVLFQKLGAMNMKFNITILNTMINAMYKVRRREEAKGLFAAISASGLVPNASTYGTMIENLLKEGSVEEADTMFSSMEKSACAPGSSLLNYIIRVLLEKGEIVKAGTYLSKVDDKTISLEASTALLLMRLFSSKGKYREQIKSLPTKYQFFDGGT